MPMKRSFLNHDHVTDEHEITHAMTTPREPLAATRGGKKRKFARRS
jgi:hypothetical protein